MIKKIVKIVLCVLAVLSFIGSVWFTITHISANSVYSKIVSKSLGLTETSPKVQLKAPEQKPYTYINIPKSDDPPLALELFPPIVHQTTPVVPPTDDGQDSEQPTDNDTTETVKSFPVIKLDMSEKQSVDNLVCKNESKYTPDINSLAHSEYPLRYTKETSTNAESQPLVLIIHTHGTECYLPEDATEYTEETLTRTTDISNNIVSVGKVLADELNQNGVPTLHCETMFDAESYSDSYSLSEKAVVEYLEKYPSIQYVFDIHRDSIIRDNNEKVKPVTEIDGTQTAQAMFVVGTDSKGANHPNWLSNLTVASIFQYALVEKYNSLMRPLNIRSASFNAEHAPGSVLIEIGTCGNTLSEAQNCAMLLGQTIAGVILNDGLNSE